MGCALRVVPIKMRHQYLHLLFEGNVGKALTLLEIFIGPLVQCVRDVAKLVGCDRHVVRHMGETQHIGIPHVAIILM